MRIELAGHVVSMGTPVPPPDLVVPPIAVTGNVDMGHYKALGYTHFDVICIGGAGGEGGGIQHNNVPDQLRSWGGAGGGGGIHRVQGLVSALPDTVAVVIGSAGNPGTSHATDPSLTTAGGDGGASSFNGATCQASGGKGGKRVQVLSSTLSSHADGGQGGIGGTSVAGGGATGGGACVPRTAGTVGDGSDRPGTPGADGTWDGAIGQGGGGGAGGVASYDSPGVYHTHGAGTNGGRGSYNPSDLSVYAPGGPAQDLYPGPFFSVIAGGAGGGRATPLNSLSDYFGMSQSTANAGVVVFILSAH